MSNWLNFTKTKPNSLKHSVLLIHKIETSGVNCLIWCLHVREWDHACLKTQRTTLEKGKKRILTKSSFTNCISFETFLFWRKKRRENETRRTKWHEDDDFSYDVTVSSNDDDVQPTHFQRWRTQRNLSNRFRRNFWIARQTVDTVEQIWSENFDSFVEQRYWEEYRKSVCDMVFPFEWSQSCFEKCRQEQVTTCWFGFVG